MPSWSVDAGVDFVFAGDDFVFAGDDFVDAGDDSVDARADNGIKIDTVNIKNNIFRICILQA